MPTRAHPHGSCPAAPPRLPLPLPHAAPELLKLMALLPHHVRAALEAHPEMLELLEASGEGRGWEGGEVAPSADGRGSRVQCGWEL